MISWCCCTPSTAYNVEKYGSTDSGTAPSSLWTYQVGSNPQTTEGIRMESALEAYRGAASDPSGTGRPLNINVGSNRAR